MSLSVLFLGLVMGMRHALEADHVAALSSLAAGKGTRSGTIRLGVLWGVGHAVALFCVGAVFLSFDWGAPEAFSGWIELAVGGMLVWLGGDLIWRMVKERVHFHVHSHGDGTRHFHAHAHAPDIEHQTSRHRHAHPQFGGLDLRALLIGIVHGMAGSAALVVLALGAVPTVWHGIAYMAVFGVGSILGMAALSVAISIPIRASAKSMTRAFRLFQGGVGVWTLGLGLVIVYDRFLIVSI